MILYRNNALLEIVLCKINGHVAQYGESVTVKGEVTGSNPVVSNIIKRKYRKRKLVNKWQIMILIDL